MSSMLKLALTQLQLHIVSGILLEGRHTVCPVFTFQLPTVLAAESTCPCTFKEVWAPHLSHPNKRHYGNHFLKSYLPRRTHGGQLWQPCVMAQRTQCTWGQLGPHSRRCRLGSSGTSRVLVEETPLAPWHLPSAATKCPPLPLPPPPRLHMNIGVHTNCTQTQWPMRADVQSIYVYQPSM